MSRQAIALKRAGRAPHADISAGVTDGPPSLAPRAGDALLHLGSVAAAGSLHAFILGWTLWTNAVIPGHGGRYLKAIAVDVVLTPVIASLAGDKPLESGAPAQLERAPGAAEAAEAASVPDMEKVPRDALPEKAETDTAKPAPVTPPPQLLTVLTAPAANADTVPLAPDEAATGEAGIPAQAKTAVTKLEPPEEESHRQALPRTKTAARPSEPNRREKPRLTPRKRARPGGSAAQAKRTVAAVAARGTAAPGVVSDYAAQVRARIARTRPKGQRANGTTLVAFALSRSGGLKYVRIARSSGRADLDREALHSVRRAAPFPAPPQAMSASQLSFRVPFYFR